MTRDAMVRGLVLALCGASFVPVALCAWDYSAASVGLARSLSLALIVASGGAFALTSVPALLLVRRRPLLALLLVLSYPAAWIGIMSQL